MNKQGDFRYARRVPGVEWLGLEHYTQKKIC